MPWTFAHPAAVLPLRRLCPRWLSFPALVVGSLVPDLGYYVPGADFLMDSHTVAGIIVNGLPWGLLILGLLCWLRAPLVHLLPQPHRRAMAPLIQTPVHITPTLFIKLALSVLIGAATHVAWDACTHLRGGLVAHVAWLQAPVFQYRWFVVPVYQVLQHLSTLLGVSVLICSYGRWLRRVGSVFADGAGDHWRYRVIMGIAMLAVIGAFWLALHAIVGVRPDYLLSVFAREFVVQGTVLIVTLYTLCALVTYRFKLARNNAC